MAMTQATALNSVGSLLASLAALAAKYPAVIELVESIVQVALKSKSEKAAWRAIVRTVLAKAGPEVAMAVADSVLKTTKAVRGVPSRTARQRKGPFG